MARYFIFVFISCCLILVEAGVRERRSPQFSQASASASATAFGGNGYHPPGYGGYGPGYGGGNFGSGFGRPVGIGGGSSHGGFGNSGYGSGYSGRRFGNQGFGNPGFIYGHGPPLSFGQGQLPSVNIAKSVSIGGTSLSSANSGG